MSVPQFPLVQNAGELEEDQLEIVPEPDADADEPNVISIEEVDEAARGLASEDDAS